MKLAIVFALSMVASVAAKDSKPLVSGANLPEFVRAAVDVLPDGYQVSHDKVVVVNDLRVVFPSLGCDEIKKKVPALFVSEGKLPIFVVMDDRCGDRAVLDLREQYLREKTKGDGSALYQLSAMIVHEVAHAQGVRLELNAMNVEIETLEAWIKEGKIRGHRGTLYIQRLKALVNSKEFIEGPRLLIGGGQQQ